MKMNQLCRENFLNRAFSRSCLKTGQPSIFAIMRKIKKCYIMLDTLESELAMQETKYNKRNQNTTAETKHSARNRLSKFIEIVKQYFH